MKKVKLELSEDEMALLTGALHLFHTSLPEDHDERDDINDLMWGLVLQAQRQDKEEK